MLSKFRIFNKVRIDSQFHCKRYVRRVPRNNFTDEIYEVSECYDRPLKSKSMNGSFAAEKDVNESTHDFFGIESDSGVMKIKETSVITPGEKYSHLLSKKQSAEESVAENVLMISFGSVRLDIDNDVKIHGQYDEMFERRLSLLQPKENTFDKRRRTDKNYGNQSEILRNTNNLMEVNEPKSARFNNDELSSPSLSNQLEIINQEGKNLVTSIKPNIIKSHDTKCNTNCDTSINQIGTDFNAAAIDKSSFVEEQYFNQLKKTNIEQNAENSNESKNSSPLLPGTTDQNTSIQVATRTDNKSNNIDEQHCSQLQKENDTNILYQCNAYENSNFIEDQYFGRNLNNLHEDSNNDLNYCSYPTMTDPSVASFYSQLVDSQQNSEKFCIGNMNTAQYELLENNITEDRNEISKNQKYDTSQDTDKLSAQSVTNDYFNMHPFNLKKEIEKVKSIDNLNDEDHGYSIVKKKKEYMKLNTEHPQTAYDYVIKLRQEEQNNEEKFSMAKEKNISLGREKLDSKGFLILKTQVQDFRHLNQDALVTLLKNSILYNDNDLVVLNKPYGLVCKGGDPKITGLNIQTCLPDLAKRIFKKSFDVNLYLVHSIDKDTTGILVLARTEKMAHLLTDLFSKNQIKKIYWTLTRGIPDCTEGIIDIPIAEGITDQKRRMILRPDDDATKLLAKPSRKAERAITHYNVISTQGNAALIEAKPETNVKHQIRIHLGFGLRCPILGDHKYSNLNKIAPQKLPDDLLRRLNIQQSKVRYVPMHLHLKTLIIPEILDGKNIFFHSNLPYHFKTNLNRLKFKKT